MNNLRSVLKKWRAKEDPRVRRRLFSWRMFAIILLVVSVLSAGNVFALEKLLKMQVLLSFIFPSGKTTVRRLRAKHVSKRV